MEKGRRDARHFPNGDGFRVGPPSGAEWGNCYVEGDIDAEATPYLAVMVTEMGRNAKWLLTVNDPEAHSWEGDGQDIGLRVYDLRNVSGPSTATVARNPAGYISSGSGAKIISAPTDSHSAISRARSRGYFSRSLLSLNCVGLTKIETTVADSLFACRTRLAQPIPQSVYVVSVSLSKASRQSLHGLRTVCN